MDLQWSEGVAVAACPVCGRVDDQRLVAAVVVEWSDEPVEIARCGGCATILMSAVQPSTSFSDDATWDLQVERGAGFDVIVQMLAMVGHHDGARMLDVGCGYGFALDLGSFLFGWHGIGVDPSIAAARGRVDLGLDIRSGLLDDSVGLDERFDVIFSSEVLEHVADPAAFVASLVARLSDDGVLLLTTPDAAAIGRDTAPSELMQALAVGEHRFLVDARGFERLLREAGLEAMIWSEGPGLRALAARSATALGGTRRDATVDLRDLVRYCDARANGAPEGSVLKVGMAARHLKYTVNLGALDEARRGVPRVRAAVLVRHGVDVEDPTAELSAPGCGVLVGVHYFLGILALNGDEDPLRAAAHFGASARAAEALFVFDGVYQDAETPVLEFHALGNRLLALAHAGARTRVIRQAVTDLDRAVARGVGETAAAADYRARADEITAALPRRSRGIAGAAWSRARRARAHLGGLGPGGAEQ